MNTEAQIIDLMTRIRALESHTAQVVADLTDLRAEMRQDVAALNDELAGLRRHMDEHFTSIRSELLHRFRVIQGEVIA
ncbi:hypothetical protein [Nonomuraea jiangxiensis]|uniref:Uncharacterized protein n=1 Tax=Nonomuraea jiangxiensis TaxID=633440 RepID=A0A1G9LK51_9ACTN|nr:hypothetical protein [Nonomuraea jiangxiensis]SDL62243.1 hypothetical protein SAMN05421869_12836 [Nonomuraea jiangxiensis]